MTTATELPIGQGRITQIVELLRSGPKTLTEITVALFAAWHRNNAASAESRVSDLLAHVSGLGNIREVSPGTFEFVPESDQPDEATQRSGTLGTNGAEPTGGPAEEADSKTEDDMAGTTAPTRKKRGRPKKNPEANGAAPAATKAQKKLPDKEEVADHLEAIQRVEEELATAKIDYEDALNIRRMKRATFDVAKSERRRFSVHEGSNLEEITAAQKKVDKAEKAFAESAGNALEMKNRVKGLEEKLSRTIAGELPLFDGPEDDEGDDDDGDEE